MLQGLCRTTLLSSDKQKRERKTKAEVPGVVCASRQRRINVCVQGLYRSYDLAVLGQEQTQEKEIETRDPTIKRGGRPSPKKEERQRESKQSNLAQAEKRYTSYDNTTHTTNPPQDTQEVPAQRETNSHRTTRPTRPTRPPRPRRHSKERTYAHTCIRS